jgi:hypothetical protein
MFASPFPTDPIKSAWPGNFFIDFREKIRKKIFRKYFRFHSRNKRKLFVQFQFGILLELRMTSSKVIEANPYRKAITTMDTTWCRPNNLSLVCLYLSLYISFLLFGHFFLTHWDRKHYYIKVVESIQFVCAGNTGISQALCNANIYQSIHEGLFFNCREL